MKFLQALYGSQYQEIAAQGKDGNKGRINGNIFLTAFIILAIIIVIAMISKFFTVFSGASGNSVQNLTGIVSGKFAGKLLAIPLFLIIYFIVSRTIGTQENFEKIIQEFKKLPDDIRKKANTKILVPFFILLIVLIILVIVS